MQNEGMHDCQLRGFITPEVETGVILGESVAGRGKIVVVEGEVLEIKCCRSGTGLGRE